MSVLIFLKKVFGCVIQKTESSMTPKNSESACKCKP